MAEKHPSPLMDKGALQGLPLPAPSAKPPRKTHSISKRVAHCAGLVSLFCILTLFFSRGGPSASHGDIHADSRAHGHFGHHGPHGLHGIRGKKQLSPKEAEDLFLTVPSPEAALAISRVYATHPHLAGSPEDFQDARVILALFQAQFGIPPPADEPIYSAGTDESRSATLDIAKLKAPTAWIDVYYPIMNTGLDRSLEILGSDGSPVWTADLREDGDERDPEAGKYKDAVPEWHGLSADGDVQGQLIYANYGTKEDYDALLAKGVNLTGKIVLTRYGAIFRGLKIKGAEDLGASGVLIYSDPRDDGPVTVQNGFLPYPAGPARNPTAVQRGSVQYLSKYPGDPSTPGKPAYQNATRFEGGETNVPRIPSLPISWANAERLLGELGGVEEGRKLSGEVGGVDVRLVNRVDNKVIPIWNTMAAIPGHIKNEVVIIGCHRDAWVMGGADPTSGTVSLHEIIRGYGELLRQGWKPLRTILFASWDAEEYGLVGSTEYGEDFADWLSEHVVTYLNLDVSVAGSAWHAQGSPSLAHLIKRTALDVPHPTSPKKTLWDAQFDQGPFTGAQDEEFAAAQEASKKTAEGLSISPLGSGSDYTVFLQRIGIASADQGFGGTSTDAVYHYHSIYDSQYWQETYADPGFHRHAAVAKHLGLLGLRLSDAVVLPLNTTQYALELDSYLDKVEDTAKSLQVSVDFSGLRAAIDRLQTASARLDIEKEVAEKEFKELVAKLEKGKGFTRKLVRWLKKLFGFDPRHSYGPGHMPSVSGCSHRQGPPPPPPDFVVVADHPSAFMHGPPPPPGPHGAPWGHPHHPRDESPDAHHRPDHMPDGQSKMDEPYFPDRPRKSGERPPKPHGHHHHFHGPPPPFLINPFEFLDDPSPFERHHLHHHHHHAPPPPFAPYEKHPMRPDHQGPPPPPHPHGPPHLPPFPGPIGKFIEAAKRVQRVNKKLASFEKGFISEEGIPDREWFRHLGVAPGKYLGYGATTLPALSEAVQYEKNATLAAYEAERLTELITLLAANVEP